MPEFVAKYESCRLKKKTDPHHYSYKLMFEHGFQTISAEFIRVMKKFSNKDFCLY